jgi:hypothetical protein
MVNTYGSTQMRQAQAWSLPAAVERELAQLERRHGQRADLQVQRQLAELGEAVAVMVLRRVGESRQPVDNLSASIGRMTMLDGATSQYPVCGWGPSRRGATSLPSRTYYQIGAFLLLFLNYTFRCWKFHLYVLIGCAFSSGELGSLCI